MPRQPQLRKKNGHWYTEAGSVNGIYFGSVAEVPHSEAKRQFIDHLKSVDAHRKSHRHKSFTVLRLAELFLDWVQRQRSFRSYDERKRHLERFCNFRVGGKRIAEIRATDITAADLTSFLAFVKDEYETDDFTTDKHATSVKAAFNWASKYPSPDSLLPSGFRPFSSVEKYKRPLRALVDDDLPTAEEFDGLLQHADSSIRDLLLCYYSTGARTSELASCNVRDFMPSTCQLIIEKHKRSKTLKEQRVRHITANSDVLSILLRNCKGKSPEDPIFTNRKGKKWTSRALATRFAQVRKNAGIREKITIYSFRHLWISDALRHKLDLATISKMAGTSINMIERVYGHFSSDQFRQAQKKLDEGRGQGNTPPTSLAS